MSIDPITLALVTGVAEGAAGVVTEKLTSAAIKAYQALKAAITRKEGAGSEAVRSIENLEKKPNSTGRQAQVAEEIADAQLATDPELMDLAQALITALKETPAGQASVDRHIEIHGGQVGVIGDNAHVEGGMFFGKVDVDHGSVVGRDQISNHGAGAINTGSGNALGAGAVQAHNVTGDLVSGSKSTVFDQRGQQVDNQTNVAGDYKAPPHDKV